MLFEQTRLSAKKIGAYAFLSLAIFLPAIYVLFLIYQSGEISSNDYWGILLQFYSLEGFPKHPAGWLVNQNGHILLIPAFIYALNIILTQGSNISLGLITWFFALFQTFLLIYLLPHNIRDWRVIIVLIFSVSAFSFTPSTADNWILGFSGVHWVGANLLAIASIGCLTRYFHNKQIGWILASLLLTALATFTYGTNLVLGLILCLGVFFILPRVQIGLLYVGCAAVTYKIYFDYSIWYFLPDYPQLSQSIPLNEKISTSLLYLTTYLGGIFSTNLTLASVAGALGLLGSMLIFGYLILHRSYQTRLDLLPWLLIQLYTLGNAFLTTITRGHMGIDQATMPRYASLISLFWISLIVISTSYLCSFVIKWDWRKFALPLTAIVLLTLAMYPLGVARANKFLHRVTLQPLAMLSINLGIPDNMAILYAITSVPEQFLATIPILKARQHVPFNHPPDNSCGQIDQILPQNLLSQNLPHHSSGNFEFVDRFAEDGVRVVGWVYSDSQKVQCIVLLNEKNAIRGLALPNFYRPDVAEKFSLPDKHTGWIGYARVSSAQERLTAHVLFRGDNYWTALPKSYSLAEPGQVNSWVYSVNILPSP